MSEEQGIVLKTTDDGWAEVVTERRDACENCGASHCCVAATSGEKMITRALNRAGAVSGDLVALSVEPGVVVKSAAALYLVPVIGFVVGAITGAETHGALGLSESGGAILLGALGLGIGYALTSLISRRMTRKGALTPTISRILEKGTGLPETSIDPVCHMEVEVAIAPWSSIHDGITYYFCSAGCKRAFDQYPQKYLKEK